MAKAKSNPFLRAVPGEPPPAAKARARGTRA